MESDSPFEPLSPNSSSTSPAESPRQASFTAEELEEEGLGGSRGLNGQPGGEYAARMLVALRGRVMRIWRFQASKRVWQRVAVECCHPAAICCWPPRFAVTMLVHDVNSWCGCALPVVAACSPLVNFTNSHLYQHRRLFCPSSAVCVCAMLLPVATGGAPLPAAASSLATLGDAESTGSPGVFVSDARRVLGRFLIVAGTAVVAMLAGASFGLFQSLVGSLGTLACVLAAH